MPRRKYIRSAQTTKVAVSSAGTFALLVVVAMSFASCSTDSGDETSVTPSQRARTSAAEASGPCAFIGGLGAGLFVEAGEKDWADPSTLIMPMLAPWGFDELRAEPANSNVTPDQEWTHHLSATVRGRTQGSLLAMAGTDPVQREAAALLLASAEERIARRDRRVPSHLGFTAVLLAEPKEGAWAEQVAGLLVQRPVSLRRVGVSVVVGAGDEGVATNREALRPILDELAAEHGVPVVDFSGESAIPATLGEVGLAVVSLTLDLEPLEACRGSDAARLQRNSALIDGLIDKLDGALGFDLPDE